jgi:beta-glucosidase-like glycosyl hydrolase
MIGFINRYNRLMQNYYELIVPRLNGQDITSHYRYYQALVKKGIAGFIVFGGELTAVREGIKKLKSEAAEPLIISSDLEQGLGQQVIGGTFFPPAMAMAGGRKKRIRAGDETSGSKLLKDVFTVMAREARYAGINTIYAPVLDINTNPINPIISVRAFGEDSRTVSSCGSQMIKAFQKYGIAACGKHFPGHGDTGIDSHIRLPTVGRSMQGLLKRELIPFKQAIADGVAMIMLGHLKVPAIDSSGIPTSLSSKTVGLLRGKMGYSGIIITDAMNMGGIGNYSEGAAAFHALRAGVNLILHPSDPKEVVTYLKKKKRYFNTDLLSAFRRKLACRPLEPSPDFAHHRELSRKMTEKAIFISRDFRITGDPRMIILNDEDQSTQARAFKKLMNEKMPEISVDVWDKKPGTRDRAERKDRFLIVAVFSSVRGWTGGASTWLKHTMRSLEKKANVFISFGSPYLFRKGGKGAQILVYWDSELALEATTKLLMKRIRRR